MRCAPLPRRPVCRTPAPTLRVLPRVVAVMGEGGWGHRVGTCTSDTPLMWNVIPGDPASAYVSAEAVSAAEEAQLLLLVHATPLMPVRVLPWMAFPRPLALTHISGTTVRCGPVIYPDGAGCLHCYALRAGPASATIQHTLTGSAGTASLVRGLWDSWLRSVHDGDSSASNPLTTPGLSVEVCLRRATMVTRRWGPHPECRCTIASPDPC